MINVSAKSNGITSRENVDSDEIDNSSDDENSEDTERAGVSNITTSSSSQKPRKPKQSNKKGGKPRQVDVRMTKKLLLDVTNKGMSNSLKWIVENLTEAAEDLEQDLDLDNNEGVPLVPIAEEEVLAMDNALFTRTLSALGIKKPADEQEIYWRIPGYFTAVDIQRTCSIINDILENGAAAIEEEPAPTPATAADGESSDEDVFDRLRKFTAKSNTEEGNTSEPSTSKQIGKTHRIVEEVSDDSEKEMISSILESNKDQNLSDDEISITESQNTKQIKIKKTKRVQIQEDSDESDVEANTETELLNENNVFEEENTANESINKKGRRLLEDSDESDKEETNDAGIAKRARGSDSDSDSKNRSIKRKRIVIDSDDE